MEIEKSTFLNDVESNLKYTYYSIPFFQKLIYDVTAHKETTFKSKSFDVYCIRGLNFYNKDYKKSNAFFNYVLNFYNFFKRDYNIYISCAYYNFIPFFDLNLKVRSEKTYKWFENFAESSIKDYDFLLDFDFHIGKNYKLMVREIFFILEYLQKHKVTFYIIPSGNNFQIVLKNNNLYTIEQIKNITENLKDIFKLEYLDLTTIATFFKIIKAPYCLVKNIVSFPIQNILPLNEFMKLENKNLYNEIFDIGYILNHKENLKYDLWNNLESEKESIRSLKSFINTYKLL
jgi:hypothetical protein